MKHCFPQISAMCPAYFGTALFVYTSQNGFFSTNGPGAYFVLAPLIFSCCFPEKMAANRTLVAFYWLLARNHGLKHEDDHQRFRQEKQQYQYHFL